MQKKYTIDDLPAFSRWPARLLGIEPWQRQERTNDDLEREYGVEKWGALLTALKSNNPPKTTEEADAFFFSSAEETLCTFENEFRLTTMRDANRAFIELVLLTIEQYLPAAAVVELGTGYGSVLLKLAQKLKVRMIGGEYSKSGVECLDILAKLQGLNIEAGLCDLTAKKFTDLMIPEKSLIFTSYTVTLQAEVTESFVENWLALKPKVVIHFEPFYEHAKETSMLGLLRRKYIEANHYNRNLMTMLRLFEAKGKLKVLEEKPCVLGSNALLPASVVVWRPV